MIAEIGLFSLVLALFFASMLVAVPSLGLYYDKPDWIAGATLYARFQCFFIIFSFVCLGLCFLQDDFSVIYVLNNSSISLPWFYKFCAVWGGHEGSMLLWVVILSLWMFFVSIFNANLDRQLYVRVLVVLGWLSIGFIMFILITSNPFARQFQLLKTFGRDLNPLLQDPGFLFHPPMLYMGYVGFSVAFAFSIAILWLGRFEVAWVSWLRPWTLAAWCCLTTGITLGSWWAYRELGWGGWWFWDPVENASFMPWLVATALLHSLAVSQHRKQFQAWTLLLAIITFSLSLVGTFLVRSGVLTSVHAFAVSPERGLYILIFLCIAIGGALTLFALRANKLRGNERVLLVSKTSALLLNNVFLVVAMLTVLLGTIYPLIIDGLGFGKLSVGAPYFNAVFVPLMVPVFFLMGIGVHLGWKQNSLKRLVLRLRFVFLLSTVLPVLLLYIFVKSLEVYAILGLMLAFWIILSNVKLVVMHIKSYGFLKTKIPFWGMVIAHCGVAICIIGISLSSNYSVEEDVRMGPGESIVLADFSIQFISEMPIIGANYKGTRVGFRLSKDGKRHDIYPEKRLYEVGQRAMTDSAIDVSLFRDIYIALGEPFSDKTWSVRLYYKPFIRWIWGGGFIILAGGMLALFGRHRACNIPPEECARSLIKIG